MLFVNETKSKDATAITNSCFDLLKVHFFFSFQILYWTLGPHLLAKVDKFVMIPSL